MRDSGRGQPRPHYNVTLAALMLAGLSFALPQALAAPVLPVLQDAFNADETAVSWIVTGYLLSASVATPISGRLGDIFGKERVMLMVLALVAAGALLSAVASSIELVIAGRMISGVGGGVFPLAIGIIRDEFPRERVPGGVGLLSAVLGFGGGLGIIAGGLLVDNLDYRWLFWLPLILALLALATVWLFVPESPIKSPAKVNWTAAALMSVGVGGLLLVISKGAAWGWGSAATIAVILVTLVALPAWVLTEVRSRSPLIDMRMMRITGVWTTNLAAFLVGIGMYIAVVLIPIFIELPEAAGIGFGASVTEAGLFVLPTTILAFIMGVVAGPLDARFGSKLLLVVGCAATSASFVLLIAAHDTQLSILVASAVLGIGVGLAFVALPNVIVHFISQSETGAAMGMNTVMRTIGGAVGVQLGTTFLAHQVGRGGYPAESGFELAFIVGAVATAIASAVALTIPLSRRRAG